VPEPSVSARTAGAGPNAGPAIRCYRPSVASLRQVRQELIDDPNLTGAAFCRTYSAAADRWLTELFGEATGGHAHGIALLAVGGYGRSELCPYSDLDVVLVHRDRRDVSAVADRLWYPVWDEGIPLDHSVRSQREVLEAAAADLRVALGLLDARVVCGDEHVAETVIREATEQWQRQRPAWLGTLGDQVAARHAAAGDVAFLLEPDLKEAHGGLRDAGALRAVMLALPDLADYVDATAVTDAERVLTRIRIELHRRAGRELNRLLLQEQDEIATALTAGDADRLMTDVAHAGRTIAWEGDDAWRRCRLQLASGRGRSERGRSGRRRLRARHGNVGGPAAVVESRRRGTGILDGEVVLLDESSVADDPELALRLALTAAERNLPISRSALNLLGRKAPAPPSPWPVTTRALFVDLLATGSPAIAAIEALEQRGLFSRYLPEWSSVRNKPQRNAYHRFTVDRHLLEATALAAGLVDRAARPDLLLVGTLLHDIGKGFPGDHTEVGVQLVPQIATRMGFPPDDVTVLTSLVRLHLLLPDMATRRDLSDPATVERVASEVGSRSTLDLLAAMVEADSQATGPSAWGSWKAGLLRELVDRTCQVLEGRRPVAPTTWLTEEHRVMMATVREHGQPALALEDPTLSVIAPDRPGLLSAVAGVLALHGLDVRAASVDGEDGIAVEIFTVEPARGRWPSTVGLAEDLSAVLAGTLPLEERLAERARTYRADLQAVPPHLVATQVTIDNDASEHATVIEVRAADVIGQLHRITGALFSCGVDVVSAHVSTFGPAVVDAFYVRGPDGEKITDQAALSRIEQALGAGVVDN